MIGDASGEPEEGSPSSLTTIQLPDSPTDGRESAHRALYKVMNDPKPIRCPACPLCGDAATDTYTCGTCNRPACGCCVGVCEGCGALVCAGCFEPGSPLDPGCPSCAAAARPHQT